MKPQYHSAQRGPVEQAAYVLLSAIDDHIDEEGESRYQPEARQPPEQKRITLSQLMNAASLSLLLYMSVLTTLHHYSASSIAPLPATPGSLTPSNHTTVLNSTASLVAFIRISPPRGQEHHIVKYSTTTMTVLSPDPAYLPGMASSHALFGSSRTTDIRLYMEPLLFHAYWKGALIDKHVASVQSCWVHHMRDERVRNKRRIVVWTDEAGMNETSAVLKSQLASMEGVELRVLNLTEEAIGSPLEGSAALDITNSWMGLAWFSDVVRYALLHRYGGVWFDLDVMWLRSVDPILVTFDTQIMVYSWENQPYPNGAVFVSLQSRAPQLTDAIYYIITRNAGFGFQQAHLSYDLPLDFLVLPCAWFDANWLTNPLNNNQSMQWPAFFQSRPAMLEKCTWDNFHAGAFTYHWHNQWHTGINHTHSCFSDLHQDLQNSIELMHAGKECRDGNSASKATEMVESS